jgi:hypothetical protein
LDSTKNYNDSVRVTGEKRKHPAVRSLARAAIAIARQKLEQEAKAQHALQSEAGAALQVTGEAPQPDAEDGVCG